MTEICLRPNGPETALQTFNRLDQNLHVAAEAVSGDESQNNPLLVFAQTTEIRENAPTLTLPPKREEKFRAAMGELGPGCEYDQRAEHVGLPKGYTFIGDGGTGAKAYEQLRQALDSPIKPGRIVLVAGPERQVPAVGHKVKERETMAKIIDKRLVEEHANVDFLGKLSKIALLADAENRGALARHIEGMIEAMSPATTDALAQQKVEQAAQSKVREPIFVSSAAALPKVKPENLPDNEYDLTMLVAQLMPGFQSEEHQTLSAGYDPETHEFYRVIGDDYTSGNENETEFPGQLKLIGSIDDTPVYMLRSDRHWFMSEDGKQQYKQLGTEDAIAFVDFAFGGDSPIGFGTSATYKPSREAAIAVLRLVDAARGIYRAIELLAFGARSYARTRGEVDEAGEPIIKQLGLGHLGGEAYAAAIQLKNLEAALRQAGQL